MTGRATCPDHQNRYCTRRRARDQASRVSTAMAGPRDRPRGRVGRLRSRPRPPSRTDQQVARARLSTRSSPRPQIVGLGNNSRVDDERPKGQRRDGRCDRRVGSRSLSALDCRRSVKMVMSIRGPRSVCDQNSDVRRVDGVTTITERNASGSLPSGSTFPIWRWRKGSRALAEGDRRGSPVFRDLGIGTRRRTAGCGQSTDVISTSRTRSRDQNAEGRNSDRDKNS